MGGMGASVLRIRGGAIPSTGLRGLLLAAAATLLCSPCAAPHPLDLAPEVPQVAADEAVPAAAKVIEPAKRYRMEGNGSAMYAVYEVPWSREGTFAWSCFLGEDDRVTCLAPIVPVAEAELADKVKPQHIEKMKAARNARWWHLTAPAGEVAECQHDSDSEGYRLKTAVRRVVCAVSPAAAAQARARGCQGEGWVLRVGWRGAGSEELHFSVQVCPARRRAVKRKVAYCTQVSIAQRSDFSALPFLVQWMEYHAIMGVGHFFAYVDIHPSLGAELWAFQRALAPYVRSGLLTLYAWPLRHLVDKREPKGDCPLHIDQWRVRGKMSMMSQVLAENDCIQRHRGEAEVFAMGDIDEYLVLPKEEDVTEGGIRRVVRKALEKDKNACSLGLSYRNYYAKKPEDAMDLNMSKPIFQQLEVYDRALDKWSEPATR